MNSENEPRDKHGYPGIQGLEAIGRMKKAREIEQLVDAVRHSLVTAGGVKRTPGHAEWREALDALARLATIAKTAEERSMPEAIEALRRIEARKGWDEADLNDFAIVEAALATEREERERAEGSLSGHGKRETNSSM